MQSTNESNHSSADGPIDQSQRSRFVVNSRSDAKNDGYGGQSDLIRQSCAGWRQASVGILVAGVGGMCGAVWIWLVLWHEVPRLALWIGVASLWLATAFEWKRKTLVDEECVFLVVLQVCSEVVVGTLLLMALLWFIEIKVLLALLGLFILSLLWTPPKIYRERYVALGNGPWKLMERTELTNGPSSFNIFGACSGYVPGMAFVASFVVEFAVIAVVWLVRNFSTFVS